MVDEAALDELLVIAKGGVQFMRNELALVLESHCLLADDLTPRRATLDSCVEGHVTALEGLIVRAEAAIAAVEGDRG